MGTRIANIAFSKELIETQGIDVGNFQDLIDFLPYDAKIIGFFAAQDSYNYSTPYYLRVESSQFKELPSEVAMIPEIIPHFKTNEDGEAECTHLDMSAALDPSSVLYNYPKEGYFDIDPQGYKKWSEQTLNEAVTEAYKDMLIYGTGFIDTVNKKHVPCDEVVVSPSGKFETGMGVYQIPENVYYQITIPEGFKVDYKAYVRSPSMQTIINNIAPEENPLNSCNHKWKRYEGLGFSAPYDFCEICDLKKDI